MQDIRKLKEEYTKARRELSKLTSEGADTKGAEERLSVAEHLLSYALEYDREVRRNEIKAERERKSHVYNPFQGIWAVVRQS